MVRICPKCKKEISPVRLFSWGWFAFWFVLGVFPSLFYIASYSKKIPKGCPECRYKNVYDEGKQVLEEEEKLREDRVLKLRKRLVVIDGYLARPKKLELALKNELVNEARGIAKELQQFGYEGAVQYYIAGVKKGKRVYSDISEMVSEPSKRNVLEANWFQRHLNWTYVIANLLLSLIVAIEWGLIWLGNAMWPIAGWVIIQKGRSLWWLLLAPVCSPLWLTNKKIDSTEGE